eukprot:jgi/Botrbrau1/11939/Bobra.341_1s0006.1
MKLSSKKRKIGGVGKTASSRKEKKAKQILAAPEPPEHSSNSDSEISEEDLRFVEENTSRLGFLRNTALERDLPTVKGKEKKGLRKEGAEQRNPVSGEEAYELVPRKRIREETEGRRAQLLPTKTPDGKLLYEKDEAPPYQHRKLVQVPGVLIEDDLPTDTEKARIPTQKGARRGRPGLSAPDTTGQGLDDPTTRVEAESDAQEPSSDEDGQTLDGEHGDSARQPVTEVAGFAIGDTYARVPGAVQELQQEEENRQQAKKAIAVACTRILEKPEGHVKDLRALVTLTGNSDPLVARWAMLSLLAVFRDIIPGYRIRPPTEKELAMPVSKEIKKLQEFESAMLASYQAYLKGLAAAASTGKAGRGSLTHVRVAVRCMAGLLVSVPHFNYASDLLQAVVARMAHKDPQIAALCCGAVRDLLGGHDRTGGAVTREAVQLVADLVRRCHCRCSPSVLESLLVLSLGAGDINPPTDIGKKKEGKKAKRRKKGGKARDDVEAAFQATNAMGNVEQRRQALSQTLEALFEVFFRVLKQCTASPLLKPAPTGPPMTEARGAAKFPLLLAALRGISQYAHLISVDYFTDLLAVMQQLLAAPALPMRARLATLSAAADILRGKGEALNLDRRGLHGALYLGLLQAPLIPLLQDCQWNEAATAKPSGATMRDQDDAPREESLSVGLVRVCHRLLVEQGKDLDGGRLAAFAKRLAGAALLSPPPLALGLLAVLERLIRRNRGVRWMLDPEAGGPAPPQGLGTRGDDLEAGAAAALSDSLWELSVMKLVPSPALARAAAALAALPPDGTQGALVFTGTEGPVGVTAMYEKQQRGRPAKPSTETDKEIKAVLEKEVRDLDGRIRKWLAAVRDAADLPARQKQCGEEGLRIRAACSALVAQTL